MRSLPAFLLTGLLVVLLAACSAPVTLKGTDLGKDPAPDFSLTDQNGKIVALSDLRGKVVVLTFLYTHCPDVCPLIAEHLRAANQLLGNAMSQVAFVAVSVDPANDTPAAIKAFNSQHGLEGKLTYLNGTSAELGPVWQAYYIGVQSSSSDPEALSHSTRVIVIDKQGRERANFDSDLAPEDLAYDVRALLGE